MADKPHVNTGKALERHLGMFQDMMTFHELFNRQGHVDERAIAIVGPAYLDSILEKMLINFMVDDEKETERLLAVDRPLGTFSSRVAAAYCLGLICKTVRDDLRTVGKIRNRFAHELHASFDSDPVRGWCQSLKWHEFSMMMKAPDGASPQDIFQVGVNQLICYLNGLVSLALHDRRTVQNSDSDAPTLLR